MMERMALTRLRTSLIDLIEEFASVTPSSTILRSSTSRIQRSTTSARSSARSSETAGAEEAHPAASATISRPAGIKTRLRSMCDPK